MGLFDNEIKVPRKPDGKLDLDISRGKIDRIKENMYKFYRTPDGEDCLEKTYYYTKYSAIAGAIFSFYEVALNSKPNTFTGAIGRFGRFTLPFAGMGLAYGTTLCLLGKIRQKTDCSNAVIAGAAAGAVWGVKYNSIHHGHVAAVILGVLCGYFRYFYIHNLPTMYVAKPEHRMHWNYFDFNIKIFDDPGRPELDP